MAKTANFLSKYYLFVLFCFVLFFSLLASQNFGVGAAIVDLGIKVNLFCWRLNAFSKCKSATWIDHPPFIGNQVLHSHYMDIQIAYQQQLFHFHSCLFLFIYFLGIDKLNNSVVIIQE